MKPLLSPFIFFFFLLSCSKKDTKLSDLCSGIMERDSFYFALPLDMSQYKAMYRLENYRAEVIDSKVQNIDFDCAVVVNPKSGQMDKLREIQGQNLDEYLKINTTHSEAVKCMIESKGIRTLAAAGQIVRFIGKNTTWDLDVQKDTFPDWKFILFREGKDPVVLPGIAVTIEEVEQYFGNEE